MLATHRRIFYCFMLALLVGVLLPMATPQAAYAQEEELGYLWSLEFDFDSSFDGLLTIEVGPWQDGDLVEVKESSQATVHCKPVGNVALDGGDAVFKGNGYLRCAMNLAEIVLHNHDLVINNVDQYGSILVNTTLNSSANTIAPIFTHSDAKYSIDFTQTSSVTMNESMWNGAGLSQASFNGVTVNTWVDYTYLYRCISNGGPCDANFDAGGQLQTLPTAGSLTQFSTGPTAFQIGSDGSNFFSGRMGRLLIDPGNSAH